MHEVIREDFTASLPEDRVDQIDQTLVPPHFQVTTTRTFESRTTVTRTNPEPESLVCGCPACGPLRSDATSRYCSRHIQELRANWLQQSAAKPQIKF